MNFMPGDWINDPGVPALHVSADRDTTSGSYFGGEPNVHDTWEWPHYQGRPLDFLACLDLAQVQSHLPTEWLPQAGQLLFFYDNEEQPWGYDGAEREGWRVFFIPEDTKTAQRAHPGTPFRRRGMRFTSIATYEEGQPSTRRPLSDDELDAMAEFIRERNHGQEPCHQVGGHPYAIQNPDMSAECELASHGINAGKPDGYTSLQGQALLNGEGKKDWKLLLQIDTDEEDDDEDGWMWGDCGMLYFWVRASQAKQGDFNDTWCVLQCC